MHFVGWIRPCATRHPDNQLAAVQGLATRGLAWAGEGMHGKCLVSYCDVKGKVTVRINANFLAPIVGKSVRVGNGDDDSYPGIE